MMKSLHVFVLLKSFFLLPITPISELADENQLCGLHVLLPLADSLHYSLKVPPPVLFQIFPVIPLELLKIKCYSITVVSRETTTFEQCLLTTGKDVKTIFLEDIFK